MNAKDHSIINAENNSIIDYVRRLEKREMIGEKGFTEYFDFKDWTKSDTLSKNYSLLIQPPSCLVGWKQSPIFVTAPPSCMTVWIGETLFIPCRAIGFPHPRMIWSKV